MAFLDLPPEILAIIVRNLDITELIALEETCRTLHNVVRDHGWLAYALQHPRFSLLSIDQALSSWSPREQTKYHYQTDNAWARSRFSAWPISNPWRAKLQPLIASSTSRMVVAAGHTLYTYCFAPHSPEGVSPDVRLECTYSLDTDDITGITFVPDGGQDRTLFVGFDTGALERIVLPLPKQGGPHETILDHSSRTYFAYHQGQLIEDLSSSQDLLLSFSSEGIASLLNTRSPSLPPQTVELEGRGWSAYLSPHSSPYAAFGTTSSTPLAIYSLSESQLPSRPSFVLCPKLEDSFIKSAVYGITSAPPASPWGASDKIVVSGWYDGHVHVHDLRSSHRSSSVSGVDQLSPVLSMYDPWSFEPIYTVACGGGSSAHVAAGSARHSVVTFWDMRAPKLGWSVHAPGNDISPVYSLVLGSSRVFGATQSRVFAYDFGPGVTDDTYPRTDVQLRRNKKRPGYYVTKYGHKSAHVP
ncbi:hypothetical protein OF83DRAFT_1281110 [Amylostereum chailletii]|nr:hypothetical protein OF83DRAFT_1281110 [Amylostereum chailletii]